MNPREELDDHIDRHFEERLPRIERRQNWQLATLAIPFIVTLMAAAVGYGKLDGRVTSLEGSTATSWEQINKIVVTLNKIAEDVAFLRGQNERRVERERGEVLPR